MSICLCLCLSDVCWAFLFISVGPVHVCLCLSLSDVSWASLFISVSLVHVCLCLSLSDVSWASLFISVSVVGVCSLSIQRSLELSLYYCLQSSSVSLSNSVADCRSSLLKSNAFFYYVTSTCTRQHLIFWVLIFPLCTCIIFTIISFIWSWYTLTSI